MLYGPSVNVNQLTEWIGIFQPTLTPDGAGGFNETMPTNVDEDREASVELNNGRKSFIAGQNADRDEYTIVCRFEPGITTAYKVSWRSTFLDVVTVDPSDSDNGWLRLIAVRREAGAQ